MIGWEENYYLQINFVGNKIQTIKKRNKQTGEKVRELVKILAKINEELVERKKELQEEKKFLETERLEKRIQEDLFNLWETGICPGIENYSRYFDGRKIGETPFTLIDYFPSGFLTIIDESHITIP